MINMKLWFTADTHFGHANIIKYTKRPFSSVEEMNEVLINNWNSCVAQKDSVIFLGDFCLGDPIPYLSELNGNVTFVQGNHDNIKSLETPIIYLVVQHNNKEIYCIHRPEDYSTSYSINLVAHVHDKWLIRKIYYTYLINIGVDVWNYKPTSLEKIIRLIQNFEEKKRLEEELISTL